MNKIIDVIASLEEYKKLFNHFFCDAKPCPTKVARNWVIVQELVLSDSIANEICLGTFILNKNELQSDADINFDINDVSLGFISYMEKDGKKIKLYCDHFLVGVVYLLKQIHITFSITRSHEPSWSFVMISGVIIKSMVEKEKKSNDYELKLLPKREGSLRVRIRIRTKDYRKNMERILFYANIFSYLEIVFEVEGLGSVPLCINGVYLFGVSRIELDEEYIEVFLKREEEQKEYSIHTYFGKKHIKIYKKHEMIYILYCPDEIEASKHIGIPIPVSNKENLYVGHSFYE